METLAILLSAPEQLSLARLPLTPPGAQDVVVDIDWSGISTGTERLLWSGRMPPFPGMGYPLVPGYESVVKSPPIAMARSASPSRAKRWRPCSATAGRSNSSRSRPGVALPTAVRKAPLPPPTSIRRR